jgi:hypothetical protein
MSRPSYTIEGTAYTTYSSIKGHVTFSCTMRKLEDGNWITRRKHRHLSQANKCDKKLPICKGKMRLVRDISGEMIVELLNDHVCGGRIPSIETIDDDLREGADTNNTMMTCSDGGGEMVMGDDLVGDTVMTIADGGEEMVMSDEVAINVTTMPIRLKVSIVVEGESLRGILLDGRRIQSFIFEEFLHQNPGLDAMIVKFLGDLFENEFRYPWSPGMGIVITLDKPYNKNPQVNVHRPSYILQNFSREPERSKTDKPETVLRFIYGTGSGKTTQGIPYW